MSEVIATDASFATCFVKEAASIAAAIDCCDLLVVWFSVGHRCDIASGATRTCCPRLSVRNVMS